MAPKQKPLPCHLYFTLTRQEASASISRPDPRFNDGPVSLMHEVRLYGSIAGVPKGKWTAGAIHIMPIARMITSTKPIEDFGYIDTEKNYLMARVFWPAEHLQSILALVANGRITEATVEVSEFKRGAKVLACRLETLNRVLRDEEFMFWVGGMGPQPVPLIYKTTTPIVEAT